MRKIADNPYPGSRAFTQADKKFFFGRDADIAAIGDLWMTRRLTVVSGAAGCGKTSLLQAGVRPRLRESACRAGRLSSGRGLVARHDVPVPGPHGAQPVHAGAAAGLGA